MSQVASTLVLALTSFDVEGLPPHFTSGLPQRGVDLFLVVSGVILALVWLVLSIVPDLLQGTAALGWPVLRPSSQV